MTVDPLNLGPCPPTMSDTIVRIIEIANATGMREEDVYAVALRQWRLPTAAPWELLKSYPYA